MILTHPVEDSFNPDQLDSSAELYLHYFHKKIRILKICNSAFSRSCMIFLRNVR